jgi:hypothetical protein
MPMKSAPCTPNSDCAISQGSRFNGEAIGAVPAARRWPHSNHLRLSPDIYGSKSVDGQHILSCARIFSDVMP